MMTTTPLVSIITPAYNAERFIVQTIESALNQTHQNWEHLIVIDCNSKDSTLKIVEDYSRRDSRIKAITSSDAKGAANNRNIAIGQARGEFITFLDADDIWKPEKLKVQLEFMLSRNCDFSFHSYTRISQDGAANGMTLLAPSEVSYHDLLKNNTIGILTVMLRKSAFPKIAFQNLGWEDYSLWLDLLKPGKKAYGFNDSLALYRIVNGSRSNNKFFAAGLRWETLRKVEKFSLIKSIYYFSHYAISGAMKHRRF